MKEASRDVGSAVRTDSSPVDSDVEAVYMSPQQRGNVRPGQFDMVDMWSIMETPQQSTPTNVNTPNRSKAPSQVRETSKLLQPHHVSHLTLKDRFRAGEDGEKANQNSSAPECEYVEVTNISPLWRNRQAEIVEKLSSPAVCMKRGLNGLRFCTNPL